MPGGCPMRFGKEDPSHAGWVSHAFTEFIPR